MLDRRCRAQAFLTLLLAVQAPGVLGCSLLLVDKPPKNHPQLSSFECSRGRGWPVTDTVLGGVLALATVAAATGDQEKKDDGTVQPISTERRVVVSVSAGALALLATGSAYYGFRAVSQCRRAQEQLAARQPDLPPSPPGGLPPEAQSQLASAGSVASQPAESPTARIEKRNGEVIEGKILGLVLLEPERKENAGVHSMTFSALNGPEIRAIDAAGIRLREAPKPTVAVVIAVDEARPPDVDEVLRTWARHQNRDLMRAPSGTLITTGAAETLVRSTAIRGELVSGNDGKDFNLVESIRIETDAGVVNIPVAELAVLVPGAVAPPLAKAAPGPLPSAGSPSADDWTTEYRGRGALKVRVDNASATTIFVKIRDTTKNVTAAQAAVEPNASRQLQLEGGSFLVLMKAVLNGKNRYFKGRPMTIPPGARGEAVLSVGVPAAGDGLEEIDAAEFQR